jgi:hypothetical protein
MTPRTPAVDAFVNLHRDEVIGTLSTFDRMIFKGHLTQLFPRGAFRMFLSRQGVLLKDFGRYVEARSAEIKAHARRLAEDAGRPFQYLESATTKRSGESKEDLARAIAERDGLDEGLVCVLSVLEPCSSFAVQGNRETHQLEVVRKARKCLHFYFYFLDPEFGLIHVRIQSWFPFSIQVYMNGRAWLARQLEREGIACEMHANAFTWIENLPRAQQLCERFARRRWPRVLDALARRVNPLLPLIRRAGFGSYYWVLDQGEYATDVMFRNRRTLLALYPDLVECAITAFGAEDVLRFLGRKLHGSFRGEITTDLKRRPEGRRVKHRMKRNALKMYDKASVLRIETTINNPREFKVLRVVQTRRGRTRRWRPMGKGVANLWRYAQVSLQANHRYLEALAHVQPKGKAISELDRLCRPRIVQGKRFARFNPITRDDSELFQAVLAGDNTIRGFRNRDLQARLYPSPGPSSHEHRRRGAHVSRLIAKLRAHKLVAKVPGCRRYLVTQHGYRIMAAAVRYRATDFPRALSEAA